MSEKELLEAVRDLAGFSGWLTYHTHSSMRSEPGFPDLVMVKPGRLIFAELKSATGRLSTVQAKWLQTLRAVPVETYLWTPDDWTSGTIEMVLTRAPSRAA